MKRREQVARAEAFRALHHGDGPLLLPNVWDPLGARLLESLGFPAVATASAAVAASRGRPDGERIPYATMLEVVRSIADAVALPLSADVERGYAEEPEGLLENVRLVLRAGAVGINLEDGLHEGGPLRPLEEQCERIRAARRAAQLEAIPLVINARIDLFLGGFEGTAQARVDEAVRRGRAYLAAGADCLYPIGPGDAATLGAIVSGTGAPVNALVRAGAEPVARLAAAGVRRISVGPNLLRAAYGAVRDAALELRDRGTHDRLTRAALSPADLASLLR